MATPTTPNKPQPPKPPEQKGPLAHSKGPGRHTAASKKHTPPEPTGISRDVHPDQLPHPGDKPEDVAKSQEELHQATEDHKEKTGTLTGQPTPSVNTHGQKTGTLTGQPTPSVNTHGQK